MIDKRHYHRGKNRLILLLSLSLNVIGLAAAVLFIHYKGGPAYIQVKVENWLSPEGVR